MKRSQYRILLTWVCLLALIFTGCQPKAPESTEPSITWDSVPQLTYGQLESEKLAVLPWYSGRCEISTANGMVETELGYYLVYDYRHLFYADKADMSNWVLVCNQPDCEHNGAIQCSAALSGNWVFKKDDRLYFLDSTGKGLYNTLNIGEIWVSTKLDGSDKQLEYVYEESHIGMSGGSGGEAQLGTVTLRKASRLNPQGEYDTHFYRIDEKGGREIQLPGMADENSTFSSGAFLAEIRGEPLLLYASSRAEAYGYYRMDGENFVKLEIGDFSPRNGYFAGNTLRVFRENDGYYDINTETGESVKLAPSHYEDSWAVILAPNCILETNMTKLNYLLMPPDYRPPLPEGECKMALFDGEVWREVALPQELQTLSGNYTLEVIGLTSDSILVYVRGEAYRSSRFLSSLYRIPVGEEEPRLEYCGEITPVQ